MVFLDKFDLYMDFVGQKLADDIYHVILIVAGCISLVVGYIYQQFSYTAYGVIGGLLLSFIICVPPWPFYRRHPLNWHKTKASSVGGNAEIKTNSHKKK